MGLADFFFDPDSPLRPDTFDPDDEEDPYGSDE